ncbi:unnamed protein product [Bursaphelenchus okinawaensis]|uniref:EB domain-containing protein n=1 Tax=Bursaphelenchus okinawaensis TaxID=465554 RepID=A0A811KS47_9BILA|nr:unnamed protein product [Bursaphelenchus okinawaensis]CAG9109882.1 unnamed protein product [Bursaphelenchus okinawaensis]
MKLLLSLVVLVVCCYSILAQPCIPGTCRIPEDCVAQGCFCAPGDPMFCGPDMMCICQANPIGNLIGGLLG